MIITKISLLFSRLAGIAKKLEDLQESIGRIEKRQLEQAASCELNAHEFKVFSQNGEDGIIQFLVRKIEIPKKIFVEFGVHDYTESNTRFLMKNDYWSGLVIDGSEANIRRIKSDELYWRHNLKAECAFINLDNINKLIESNGIAADIGLLSVDIDGNDYWVWEAIDCISPRIVVCEYNSLFGPTRKVTSIYSESFVASKAHYSGLYWGASIAAFDHLAKAKGYSLVGSNRMGNNLFFVRNDVIGDLKTCTPEEAYVKSQFRISRNEAGNLTYLNFEQGRELIADMPLYDIENDRNIKVREI
ncbi:MAG: hypothetical protein V4568_01395 [Pseudomonadota bacterium]